MIIFIFMRINLLYYWDAGGRRLLRPGPRLRGRVDEARLCDQGGERRAALQGARACGGGASKGDPAMPLRVSLT